MSCRPERLRASQAPPELPLGRTGSGIMRQVDSPSESLTFAESVATDDVNATFHLLRQLGFVLAAGVGRGETMGNVFVEFTRGAESVQITRDRHQWMMCLRRPSWRRAFDLDIVLDAISGREEGSSTFTTLPTQLPPDVSWVEALPKAWAWLDRTPDSEALLTDFQRRRGRSLFSR